MEHLLTEGARRVLKLAARLACERSSDAVAPAHVLWALTLDESRASELLAAQGVTAERLRAELPLPEPASATVADAPPPPHKPSSPHERSRPADPASPHVPSLPHTDAVREVLVAARQRVADAGRPAEIGTEFLLYGLAEVESDVALLLRRFGLDPARTGRQAAEVSGQESSDLDVDFSIAWRDQTQDERTDTLRILDAAANRAREGIRVVEDYVRFALDDGHLAMVAKTCRHELASALEPLGPLGLIAARDTRRDVGTTIRVGSEQRRGSPRDVLKANLKRAQEALRTLEEFGKVVSPDAAGPLGEVRYQLYTLEKAVLSTEASRRRLEGRTLYLLVTEGTCHHGSGPAVRGGIAGGVSMVQVREKGLPDRRLLEHARRIREWTRETRTLFIMNDRADIAVSAEADGVHVGQDELPVREARRIVGPDRLIGVSTHTLEQARQAVLDGADYLGVGPVFPSGTKRFDKLAGLELVRQVAAEIALPWFAIGGITPDNAPQVVAAGARRLAVSGAICTAEDPAEAATRLAKALM